MRFTHYLTGMLTGITLSIVGGFLFNHYTGDFVAVLIPLGVGTVVANIVLCVSE